MVTSTDIAEWRRKLAEEGDGEFLNPRLAQVIVARLMAEVERLQALLRQVAPHLAEELVRKAG